MIFFHSFKVCWSIFSRESTKNHPNVYRTAMTSRIPRKRSPTCRCHILLRSRALPIHRSTEDTRCESENLLTTPQKATESEELNYVLPQQPMTILSFFSTNNLRIGTFCSSWTLLLSNWQYSFVFGLNRSGLSYNHHFCSLPNKLVSCRYVFIFRGFSLWLPICYGYSPVIFILKSFI